MTTNLSDCGWIKSIQMYLSNGDPLKGKEGKKLGGKAAHYALKGGEQYVRGFLTALMKCLTPPQVDYILHEIHRGVCRVYWLLLANQIYYNN